MQENHKSGVNEIRNILRILDIFLSEEIGRWAGFGWKIKVYGFCTVKMPVDDVKGNP